MKKREKQLLVFPVLIEVPAVASTAILCRCHLRAASTPFCNGHTSLTLRPFPEELMKDQSFKLGILTLLPVRSRGLFSQPVRSML
jgi:CDGSH-type Zn-finger protein